MNEWDPATEAEAAMRDALVAADQELYFRILARTDLLLPVSPEALAGRAPMGWGTWTTGNRTHILAFTSPNALQLCLNEPTGSYRAVPFVSLAAEWPNYEWWLAIDPGLPIEAYLPSWFVSQLTRDDVRLPGRTMGARARMAQGDLAAALSGRMRASNPPPPVLPPPPVPTVPPPPVPPPPVPTVGPVSARISMGTNGRSQPVETVEAEIIDYPPAAGSARIYAPTSPSGGFQPGYSSGYDRSSGYEQSPVYNRGYEHTTYDTDTRYDAGTRYDTDKRYDTDPVEPPGFFRPTQRDPGTARDLYTETVATAAPSLGERLRSSGANMDLTADRPPAAASASPAWTPRQGSRRDTQDAEIVSSADSWPVGFAPANETESNLLAAAEENNTDAFLSTLLLARIILPVPISTPPGSRPRDKYFPWQIEGVDSGRMIAVFTSPERMAEHGQSRYGPEMSSMSMRFIELIGAWPNESIAFAINPGSPVGATLPGSQIVALAAWAAEVGLRDEPAAEVVVAAKKHEALPSLGVAGAPTAGAAQATVMQRTVPPAQLPYYLERGYDRVSGFINRASEVSHLITPQALYRALGLVYAGSPFNEDDTEAHVLRWVAHRADLYRLPYGGQHEAAMRAMQGWVIERAPFRGNGFAPGDTDVVAEFKVDSVRLPHGAQMWRLAKDGTEALVASFDADAGRWVAAH